MHFCTYLASIEADPFADVWSLKDFPIVHTLGYWLGLPLLPAHAHEILFFAAVFSTIYVFAGILSPFITPRYAKLDAGTRAGFSNHVVSEVNAIALLVLSFPLFFSRGLTTLTSYTPYAGLVDSVCIGYFLWDVFVSVRHVKSIGWGFVLHALAALFTFAQGMRPFMYNYAAAFIWFEASTPFVNVHWYAMNVPGFVSNRLQFYNGAALIIVFFLCRIIPGPINGYFLFREALFSRPKELPIWLVVVELTCYLSLVSLNFYWFGLMLKVAFETLTKKSEPKEQEHVSITESNQQLSKASSATATVSTSRARKRKV